MRAYVIPLIFSLVVALLGLVLYGENTSMVEFTILLSILHLICKDAEKKKDE